MEYKFVKEGFDQNKFLNELSLEIKSLIVGLKHEGPLLTVYTNLPISELQNSILTGYVNSHDPSRSLTTEEQYAKDKDRFKKRYESIGEIMSTMAAGNIKRVRSGIWTTSQLISLTQDIELKQILDDVNTLSFEIAYSRIDGLTNELLTPEIKAEWKQLLYENFYL